jgi:hypothetical protein
MEFQEMESTTGDPVNLRPNEMFPSFPPTQEVVDIFANTMKILEGQNLVLSQLVQNVIHNRYQGLSQTSLSDSLPKQYQNLLWRKSIYSIY